MKRTASNPYRCRGLAAYDGPCGGLDCATCYPATYIQHYEPEGPLFDYEDDFTWDPEWNAEPAPGAREMAALYEKAERERWASYADDPRPRGRDGNLIWQGNPNREPKSYDWDADPDNLIPF